MDEVSDVVRRLGADKETATARQILWRQLFTPNGGSSSNNRQQRQPGHAGPTWIPVRLARADKSVPASHCTLHWKPRRGAHQALPAHDPARRRAAG